MRPHPWATLVIVASVAGFFFAAVSTRDFAAHLDRQIHGVHCSFLPGLSAADASGASDCHVTMMSPYASFWSHAIWGGVPIALPAMAVFAFLLFWVAYLITTGRQLEPRATGFLAVATGLPLVTSLVMGWIAMVELHAACKLCIGIYIGSTAAAAGGLGLWLRARRSLRASTWHAPSPGRLSWAALAGAVGIGSLFVSVPVATYAWLAPDFSRYAEGCGQLRDHAGADALLVPLGGARGGTEIIEVLDPLCPACRGFESRFDRWATDQNVWRRALLFPLDNTCNWMVDHAVHPGACALSEAMLCAGDDAPEVLAWAFEEQAHISQTATQDPRAAAQLAVERFPQLRGCIGTPAVRARLNRALRWAVANELPLVTPQVYVAGKRVCDEDTDLGLDYVLSRMLEKGSVAP